MSGELAMARIVLTLVCSLVAIGCGRSSLIGTSSQCPAGRLPDGSCVPMPDMTVPDLGDGGGGDMPDAGDPCADPNNCLLPICVGDPRCHVPGTEICNNCIDDNDNGLIDCADPQCFNFPGCEAGHTCDPNHVDCSDPQCACGPLCKDLKCMPTVDFGTLAPTGSTSTRMVDTTGTKDVTMTPCAPGGAGMVVGKFTLTGAAAVVLSYSQGKGEDHVFGIFQAGTGQVCGAAPIANACYDPKSAATGKHTYLINGAGEYYVIVQPFEPAGQGPLTVTLSTGCPGTVEICDNGVDDNCNGLVDCADPQCVSAPNCVAQECKPDFNVGAVVVDAPGKMVSFDTTSADVENNVSCDAATGGKDVVVRFTLKETAGIELQWDQTGDHVVALMRTPSPGHPCDFNQLSCYDPSGRTTDTVAWQEQPAGDYLFIFKATRPGAEGHIDATISAFKTRSLCKNPDDCAKPECFGINGCTGPYCMPNVELGQMNVGDSKTVSLDVATDGITGYKTSCGKGGGKGMVVQLTVPHPGSSGGVGIGFDCTQTGDQVLDLYAQTAPRDLCDANELVCADPKSLPFGCGYEVPNLQPGTYNVIVEGFAAGTEGTVQLTLSIVDDRQIIDCSQPGACSNRQCYTSQYCTKNKCRADQTINPMPLDGSQLFELVQTAGSTNHAKVPCATTPGGNAAVIGLFLTAAADLTLSWQQIGNHDFALYTDTGPIAPCDAGTVVQCQKGTGLNQSGSTKWINVPQGQYWLVVGADAPDMTGDGGTMQSSGSVDIALSGTTHK
jgi:hypothetical protein